MYLLLYIILKIHICAALFRMEKYLENFTSGVNKERIFLNSICTFRT